MQASDGSARRAAPATRTWAAYGVVVVVGLVAWVALWLAAFGFRGVDVLAPAAIPGWVALAVAPAIGMVLGWRLPLVAGRGRRAMLAVMAPLLVVAVPVLVAAAGSAPALLALVLVYAAGPVVIGRLLRLAGSLLAAPR